MIAAQVVVLVLFPALALWLSKYKPASWLGPVALCYAAGLALRNGAGSFVDGKVSMNVAEAAVPLALPLLLLSTDFRAWLKLAKRTIASCVLACVAAMSSAALVGRLYADKTDEWWKMAGMLVGVYTGGTANMSAIGLALGVRDETFVLLNAADVLAGGAYFVFLLTVAQRLTLLFLPRFRRAEGEVDAEEPELPPPTLAGVATGVGLSVLMAGAGVGVSWLVYGKPEVALVLLTLSTLALAASFVPRLRALPGSFQAGEYLLLVFCVAIGSLADVREVSQGGSIALPFCFAVMFLAVVLHFLAAAIFRIDADTVLITSTATIFGPAFVGPVAKALNNRAIIVSGVTTGLVGYAVGTYLGLLTSWLLKP